MARLLVVSLIGGGIALAANMLSFSIVAQINQKLPKEKHLSFIWWGSEIKQQHRELYPNSKRVPTLNALTAGLVVWFLVSVWVWVMH